MAGDAMKRTAETSVPAGLEMPALQRHADAASGGAQSTFIRATKVRLILLTIVAVSGALTFQAKRVDFAGVAAASAFGLVGFLEAYLWRARPEKSWYGARAIAESIKTLAWRYAVRAAPFGDDSAVDSRLLDRLRRVQSEVSALVVIPHGDRPELITSSMRALRALPFEQRRATYLRDRIENQISWYRLKARWNDARATAWSVGLMFLNAGGMVAAICKATGIITVDVLGFVGAAAAAGVAWMQTRQYASLAAAYATTHHELTIVRERILIASEDTWAREVSDAEEAISREHTMWQASRSEGSPIA
jgi:hypothetical protein